MRRRFQLIVLVGLIACLVTVALVANPDHAVTADTMLDEPFAISIADNHQTMPALAYNETTGEFLVAWVDERNPDNRMDIFAQRLAGNGTLLGGEIEVAIAPNHQSNPDIVVRSGSPEYLVVWSDYRNVDTSSLDIWGQPIGADGAVLGDNTRISNRPGQQRHPAVGYCASSDSYFTVWEEDEDAVGPWKFFIFGQQVSAATHQPVGTTITVTADYEDRAFQQVRADLVCNPAQDECLALFRDARDASLGSGSNNDIYGQRLSCVGETLLRDDIPITVQYSEKPGGNKQNAPVGAYNDRADQYMIVWQDERNDDDASSAGDHGDIYGQLLSGVGRRLNTGININIPITTATGHQEQPAIAYSTRDNLYLVVWADYRGADADIYGQVLLPSGFPIGPEIVISDATGDQVAPAVAYNQSTGQFLIVWQDHRMLTSTGADIYGYLLNPQSWLGLYLPMALADGQPAWPETAEAAARSWLQSQTNRYDQPGDIPGYNRDGCDDQVVRYDNADNKTCYPAIPGDALVSFDFCGPFGTDDQERYLGKYGRGFIYDQAVGAIAWMLAGETETARRLLTHIASYQNEDGSFGFSFNGRGCNQEDADSFYDATYIRSGTISWIAYAFVMYYRVTGEDQFLDAAKRAADYLLSQQQVQDAADPRDGLIRGGSGTYTRVDSTFKPGQIEWVSVEHNIDAYFLMRDLAEATGNDDYARAAMEIRQGLLEQLWNEEKGRFDRGLGADGQRDTADTLDAASWGAIFLTAIGETEKAQRSLDFAHATYGEWTDRLWDYHPGWADRLWGYKPDAGNVEAINWDYRYIVWSEGSLGMAIAYMKLDGTANRDRARAIIAEMAKLQEIPDANGGLLYAVYAGYEADDFARAPSVAGTGWFVMALQSWSDPVARDQFWGGTP